MQLTKTQFPREVQKLKSMMDEELWDLLADFECILAGGALTSMLSGKEVNDLDVYFRDKQSLQKVIEAIYNRDVPFTSAHIISYTDKSILLQSNGNMVQFIAFDYFHDMKYLFDSFDYTINMVGVNMADEQVEMHPDCLKHIAQRYLHFNPGTAYPLISMLRVAKYKEKGYNISKQQLFKLMLAINSLNLNSWDEMIHHIGGMYGTAPKDIFDTTVPFSLDTAIEMLDNCKMGASVMPSSITQEELAEQFKF